MYPRRIFVWEEGFSSFSTGTNSSKSSRSESKISSSGSSEELLPQNGQPFMRSFKRYTARDTVAAIPITDHAIEIIRCFFIITPFLYSVGSDSSGIPMKNLPNESIGMIVIFYSNTF